MKAKEIKNYLVENYGECRHDENKMSTAINQTSKIFSIDARYLFHFIVENVPMTGTHSYGFHTAYGREIHRVFEGEYYGG